MQITNMAANNDVLMNKRFEEAFDLIKYVFKVEKLYDDQTKLIIAFCNGSNVFFNAPTGYGKSIVFQSLPWVTDVLYEQTIGFSTLIVISPLQSLMEDQCNRMKDIGISSIALYSDNAVKWTGTQAKRGRDDCT
jgi:superfamily II DNA helicase RecQ